MPKPIDPKTPQQPEGRRSLWNYPLFSLLLALFFGIVAWTVVAAYVYPQSTYTVKDVPINYTYSASTYTALGLDIVEKPELEAVDVRVDLSLIHI